MEHIGSNKRAYQFTSHGLYMGPAFNEQCEQLVPPLQPYTHATQSLLLDVAIALGSSQVSYDVSENTLTRAELQCANIVNTRERSVEKDPTLGCTSTLKVLNSLFLLLLSYSTQLGVHSKKCQQTGHAHIRNAKSGVLVNTRVEASLQIPTIRLSLACPSSSSEKAAARH